eukprot:gene2886-10569_t
MSLFTAAAFSSYPAVDAYGLCTLLVGSSFGVILVGVF